jgi:hypothetical protein
VDTAGLTARWARAWGDWRPVSHELPVRGNERWVRFHSLPGSKRYAGNEDEYAEIMRRHLTVLAELLSHDNADAERELMVVTVSWSDAPGPVPRTAELSRAMPAAAYWTSVLTGINDPDDTWWHLWVSAARLHSQELSQLLRLVADDGTAGVIITTADMGWLYAPYDGGADVIAATADHRNQLHRAHKDWLSDHPAGL